MAITAGPHRPGRQPWESILPHSFSPPADDRRSRHVVCRLRDLLGSAFLQVTLRNYGAAQENASRFFTEARQTASSTDTPELRSTLEALLAQRDDVAAKLGRGAAEAYPQMQQMYRTLIEQTDAALSSPAGR
jgi:hypothetical protein